MDVPESETAKILRLVDALAISMQRGFERLSIEIEGVRTDLRAELRGEIGSVRGEIGGVRTELRGEIGKLRHDMNKRFDRVDERFDAFDRRVAVLEAASHTHLEL